MGWKPLGPLAWPGLGLLLGAALWGASGALGGALVVFAYYMWNLAEPQRFPHFFSSAESIVFWTFGLAVLAAVAVVFRARLAHAQQLALNAARTQAELEAQRDYGERLRTITDNVPALIGYIDIEQRFQFNSLAYEHWLGKPRAEITGRAVREVLGEPEYQKVRPYLERALGGGRVDFHVEHSIYGETRHVQTSYVPDFDPRGRVRGCFVVAKDIASVVQEQSELRAAHQRLEAALEISSVALWDADLQSGKVYLSEAWAAMIGVKAGDTFTTLEELASLVHPADRDAVRRSLRDALKGTASAYIAEHRVRAASGEWKWILSRGRVTQRDPASGRALRMIGTNVDIHDRKLTEEAIERRAQDGASTGVASQTLLLERLRRAMARSQRSGTPLALMHLDLDRFKPISDSLGPEAGDALLKDLALRLRGCVRVTDTVARIGADQFVVLLEGLKDRGDAFRVAEKMLHAVREPVSVGGREVRLTTSIGVAFPENAELPPEELVKRAASALSEAKAAGRDSYRIGLAGGASR